MLLGGLLTAKKRPKMATVEAGLLFLFVLLAGCLRCDRLALPLLSTDEAFSWRLTTYSVADLLHHMPGDVHPPLYYLLLKGWITLFGDSPFVLRSLSVLFSLASIVVLYALCREAAARFLSVPNSPLTSISGALFAALLLALHIASVDEPSRNTRMYSQGIFLAGLTAWLLLRALRCPRGGLGWWLGYGLAVAAFCYTHYYAFFTVAAQSLFVAGDLAVRALKNSTASVRSSLTGFLLAGAFAFLLYVPWLPVWWKQTHDVLLHFWIPPIRWEYVRDVFFRWSSSLPSYHPMDFRLWVFFLLACIVWMVGKGDRGGLFLLIQASIPWGLSLALSAWSDRPIFQERYLYFAQFSLFAFWGIVWDRLASWLPRLGLACLLCTMSVFGLMRAREQWPSRPPALAEAAASLCKHYQEGDVVLTGDPKALNRLRYYASQAGMLTIKVRCVLSPFQPPGHAYNHLGSLQADDVLWNGLSLDSYGGRRVWTLVGSHGGTSLLDDPWREVSRWSFGGGSEGHCQLILYERS
ncbi:MAG: glycosyltransferase family 39 protein [Gemmataceae bacterium]